MRSIVVRASELQTRVVIVLIRTLTYLRVIRDIGQHLLEGVVDLVCETGRKTSTNFSLESVVAIFSAVGQYLKSEYVRRRLEDDPGIAASTDIVLCQRADAA